MLWHKVDQLILLSQNCQHEPNQFEAENYFGHDSHSVVVIAQPASAIALLSRIILHVALFPSHRTPSFPARATKTSLIRFTICRGVVYLVANFSFAGCSKGSGACSRWMGFNVSKTAHFLVLVNVILQMSTQYHIAYSVIGWTAVHSSPSF